MNKFKRKLQRLEEARFVPLNPATTPVNLQHHGQRLHNRPTFFFELTPRVYVAAPIEFSSLKEQN